MSRKARDRRAGRGIHSVRDVLDRDESEPRTSSAPTRGRSPGPLPTPEAEEVEESDATDQDA